LTLEHIAQRLAAPTRSPYKCCPIRFCVAVSRPHLDTSAMSWNEKHATMVDALVLMVSAARYG
jgi:hypothetical protein